MTDRERIVLLCGAGLTVLLAVIDAARGAGL